MTLATAALLLFAASGLAALAFVAVRDNRRALGERLGLLDEVRQLFESASITPGPDAFPVLEAALPDGRSVAIEIVPDTLVCRRLPQLWLKLTIRDPLPRRRPTIGALSRSTGAEFYSMVHGMPDRVDMQLSSDLPLLVRGHAPSRDEVESATGAMRRVFADPLMKEAAITPKGVRIVRRLAEGSRGAHVLLRQAKFAVRAVPARFVMEALSAAEDLAMAFEIERPDIKARLETAPQ